jgi:hypothetical protein
LEARIFGDLQSHAQFFFNGLKLLLEFQVVRDAGEGHIGEGDAVFRGQFDDALNMFIGASTSSQEAFSVIRRKGDAMGFEFCRNGFGFLFVRGFQEVKNGATVHPL